MADQVLATMPAPQTSPTATTARRGKLGVLLGPEDLDDAWAERLAETLWKAFAA